MLTLTDSLVNEIFSKYSLGDVELFVPIRGGLINPTYLINHKYVLKLESQTYEVNPDKFKKEALLLSLLPHHAIPTPKVIAFDDSLTLIKYPYLILEYVKGKDIATYWTQASPSQHKNIASELGSIAKKIHSLTASDLNHHPLFGKFNQWLKRNNSDFNKYWQVVKESHHLSNYEKQRIENIQQLFLNLNLNGVEKLIHGDFFTAGNIQVDDGHIVGIFDFEYSCITDPLWDFHKLPLAFHLQPEFNYQSFFQGYGLEKFTEEEKIRIQMYCFHQGVWEIWATLTQFMPFGNKEIAEGQQLINNTISNNWSI